MCHKLFACAQATGAQSINSGCKAWIWHKFLALTTGVRQGWLPDSGAFSLALILKVVWRRVLVSLNVRHFDLNSYNKERSEVAMFQCTEIPSTVDWTVTD